MIKITKAISCPVFLYNHFKNEPDDRMEYCTTAKKFDNDIKLLLKNGYKSISLQELHSRINNKQEYSDDPFCIVMVGGYESNYSIAFNILKKYNIKADIFIATDLVGLNYHKKYDEIIPHFTWEQAQEMVNSGLVDIHGYWHPLDDEKGDFNKTVIEKNVLISNKINKKSFKAFYCLRYDNQIIEALYELGINVQIIDMKKLNPENIHKGCVGRICINYETDLLDVLESQDLYKKTYIRDLSKELSVISEINTEAIYNKFKNNNPETIELPVNKKPIISNYLRNAMPLSVLFVNREDKYNKFIINNYIDLIAVPYNNMLDYNNYLYYNWDSLDFYRIHREHIIENDINVLCYIYNGLKKGYYSDISLDAYYIPGKNMYKQIHFTHQMLIYGYDQINNEFKTLTYTENGYYNELNVKLENLIEACSNNYFVHINLFKRELSARVDYNIKTIRDKLQCYLNSTNYDLDNMKYNKVIFDECYFGVNACKWLIEYILSINNESMIDLTNVYTYSEHKNCMAWRLEYIVDREKISSEDLSEKIKLLRNNSEMILKLSIKYNFKYNTTTNSNIKNRIAQYIVETNHAEIDGIGLLLEQI